MIERRTFSIDDFLPHPTLEQIEVAADQTLEKNGGISGRMLRKGLAKMVSECNQLWADWPVSDMVFLQYETLLHWAVLIQAYKQLPQGHPLKRQYGNFPNERYARIFNAVTVIK